MNNLEILKDLSKEKQAALRRTALRKKMPLHAYLVEILGETAEELLRPAEVGK